MLSLSQPVTTRLYCQYSFSWALTFLKNCHETSGATVAASSASRNIDIFKKKLIFIPDHLKHYWSLACLVSPRKYENYFPSINYCHKSDTITGHLHRWLAHDWRHINANKVAGHLSKRNPLVPIHSFERGHRPFDKFVLFLTCLFQQENIRYFVIRPLMSPNWAGQLIHVGRHSAIRFRKKIQRSQHKVHSKESGTSVRGKEVQGGKPNAWVSFLLHDKSSIPPTNVLTGNWTFLITIRAKRVSAADLFLLDRSLHA